MSRVLLDQVFCIRLIQSLAHFLWQGAALWLVAVIGGRLLRSRSPQARYILYIVIFGAMAVCVPLTFWMLTASDHTLESLANQRVHVSGTAGESSTAGASSKSAPADGSRPFSQGGAGAIHSRTAATNAQNFWGESSGPLTVVYVLGVGWMLLRIVAALRGGQRLSTCSQPIDEPAVLTAIARAVKAMQFAYNPAIAFCRAIAGPSVVGILQPMLLFPVAIASGMTPEQIEYIARHELAHIRRYDHIANLIQRFIEAFLFFHPAIWHLSQRIRNERELCCDELVLATGCGNIAYAESLTRAARLSMLSQIAPLSLAATGPQPSEFSRRIRWLTGLDDEHAVRLSRRSTAFVASSCLLPLLCLALLTIRVVPASTLPPPGERLGDLGSEQRHPENDRSASVTSGWSYLHRAIADGDLQEIQMLLSNKADPNVQTHEGWTPMHFAACLNRVEVIRMLIDAGGIVDARNKDGCTPLMSALGLASPLNASMPAEAAADELLRQQADVNSMDARGFTPLYAVVLRGHVALARELLQRGARVDAIDKRGRTPLHYACTRADLPMIKLLLQYNANARTTDVEGRSPMQQLTLSVRETDMQETVRTASQLLLQAGARHDFCTAIVAGDDQLVTSMLEQDPSLANKLPAITFWDWRPIHWAAESGNASICDLLLGSPYHADPNVRGFFGRTPLHRAVMHDDRLDVVQSLLKAGANPSCADKPGLTPLHIAATSRQPEALKLLLSANADPNATELSRRRTALHLAVIQQDARTPSPIVASVVALVASNANVNAIDDQGRAALHYACAEGRLDLVEALLVAKNIDVNIPDNSGATPLSLAISSSKSDSRLIELLIEHGAIVSTAKK